MKAVDPRRRPSIDLEEPSLENTTSKTDERPLWSMLQAMSHVILRKMLQLPSQEAKRRISKHHKEPPDRVSHIYPSMDVIYRGRSAKTSPMNEEDLIGLLKLYVRAVEEGDTRIRNRIQEDPDGGAETAAAMVYIQCREGKLAIPHRTFSSVSGSSIAPEPRITRAESISPALTADMDKPIVQAAAVPYRKWGLLEGLGYFIMTDVMHMPESQIRTVIPLSPGIISTLTRHRYAEMDVEFDNKVLRAPRVNSSRAKTMLHNFLLHKPENADRIKKCFDRSKQLGYQKAASMVYVEAQASKEQPSWRRALTDSRHAQSRQNTNDYRRNSLPPANPRKRTRESERNSADHTLAGRNGHDEAEYYVRIFEVWSLLDIINYTVLRSKLNVTKHRIAKALNTRLCDIEKLMFEPSPSMTNTIWPPVRMNYNGKDVTSVSMYHQDIRPLVHQFTQKDAALDRIKACYDKYGEGCEQAATMIYCETYPSIKHLISPVGQNEPASSQAPETQPSTTHGDSIPLFNPDYDAQDLDNSRKRKLSQVVHEQATLSEANTRKVKTWSALNNLQKAARREPAPNIAHLNLISTGKASDREVNRAAVLQTSAVAATHVDPITQSLPPQSHPLEPAAEKASNLEPGHAVSTSDTQSPMTVRPMIDKTVELPDEDIILPEAPLVTATSGTLPETGQSDETEVISIQPERTIEHVIRRKPDFILTDSESDEDEQHAEKSINKSIDGSDSHMNDASSEPDDEDIPLSIHFPMMKTNPLLTPTTTDADARSSPWPSVSSTTTDHLHAEHFMAMSRIFAIPETARHVCLVEKYIRLKMPHLPVDAGTTMYVDTLLDGVAALDTSGKTNLGLPVLQQYLALVRGAARDGLEFLMDIDAEALNLTERYLRVIA